MNKNKRSLLINLALAAAFFTVVAAIILSRPAPDLKVGLAGLPSDDAVLPVVWGDLGAKMVQSGVIDQGKFEALYASRGGLNSEEKKLLLGRDDNRLKITSRNAEYLLNLFWALGLGQKNPIILSGEMMDSRYGGGGPPAGGFASTGGWSLAAGSAMEHYGKHEFFTLTSAQQTLVEKISRGIYRPCCDNSTHFPDCNHGMAMLGLLELMASQGASEEEMWKAALSVNAHWFPDNYALIADYFKKNGVAWKNVDPRKALSAAYSSRSGYARLVAEMAPLKRGQGNSCSI